MRMHLAASTDLLGVSRWRNGVDPRPPPGFDDAWKSAVLARQQADRRWVRSELGHAGSAGARAGGRLLNTPWASEKVERLYLLMPRARQRNHRQLPR
jgi:hypothetical protein